MKKYYLITSIFVASISLVLLSYSVLSLKNKNTSNESVVLSANASEDATEENTEDVQNTNTSQDTEEVIATTSERGDIEEGWIAWNDKKWGISFLYPENVYWLEPTDHVTFYKVINLSRNLDYLVSLENEQLHQETLEEYILKQFQVSRVDDLQAANDMGYFDILDDNFIQRYQNSYYIYAEGMGGSTYTLYIQHDDCVSVFTALHDISKDDEFLRILDTLNFFLPKV